jgi:hypothetical protein
MRSAASAAHDLPSLVDSCWRKAQSAELDHGLGPVAVFFESSEIPENSENSGGKVLLSRVVFILVHERESHSVVFHRSEEIHAAFALEKLQESDVGINTDIETGV